MYAVFHVGFALFLFAAMKYVQNEWPAWAPGLAFGVLFCVHLSTGWWIPAFLLLPLLKASQKGGAKSSLFDAIYLYTASLAFVALFWGALALYGYGGNVERMVAHFFSDQVMYVGTDAAMFRPLQDYFTMDYYLNMANEYFYMAPAVILLFPVLVLGFRRWGNFEPVLAWIACFALFYFIYSVTWRPDRHFPNDWDLFSGLTIPAVLLVGGLVSRMKISKDAAFYLFYQASAFSFLYLVLQLSKNHYRITSWPNPF